MIRTFIALELKDKETIENISAFGARLKQNQTRIKIVEPQNLHLTVKFLGNIQESKAPKIYNILKSEGKGLSARDIILKAINDGLLETHGKTPHAHHVG